MWCTGCSWYLCWRNYRQRLATTCRWPLGWLLEARICRFVFVRLGVLALPTHALLRPSCARGFLLLRSCVVPQNRARHTTHAATHGNTLQHARHAYRNTLQHTFRGCVGGVCTVNVPARICVYCVWLCICTTPEYYSVCIHIIVCASVPTSWIFVLDKEEPQPSVGPSCMHRLMGLTQ